MPKIEDCYHCPYYCVTCVGLLGYPCEADVDIALDRGFNVGGVMAWTPSEEYWANKLNREREAIEALVKKIPTLTERGQIDAHKEYLNAVRKVLKFDEERYRSWRNKQLIT